jgi:glycosyltransferase involved in cell wall biosynthesis
MKILFLTTVLPSGLKTGGEVASNAIIKALKSCGHDVDVCGYVRSGDSHKKLNHERPVGVRHIETETARIKALVWFLGALLRSQAYSVYKYISREYQESVRRLIGQNNYALCVIDHAQMGWILKILPADLPVVFVAHNVEEKIYATQAKNSRNLFRQKVMRREQRLIDRLERSLAAKSLQVWTLSTADASYFGSFAGVGAFSLGVPSAFDPPGSDFVTFERDIGILGTWTWGPNALGLEWFFAEVYPKLPEKLRIHVAGKGAEWLINKYANVEYLGFVNNAAEFLKSSRVVAIPSTQGSGIQIKTLDAIASGAPVVATSVALRGIECPPSSVVVADHCDAFARGILSRLDFSEREEKSISSRRWSEDRNIRFLCEIDNAMTLLENL